MNLTANSNLSYSTVPFPKMNQRCFGEQRDGISISYMYSGKPGEGIIADCNFTGENGGVVAEASEELQIFFIQLLIDFKL